MLDSALRVKIKPVREVADVCLPPLWIGVGRMNVGYDSHDKLIEHQGKLLIAVTECSLTIFFPNMPQYARFKQDSAQSFGRNSIPEPRVVLGMEVYGSFT